MTDRIALAFALALLGAGLQSCREPYYQRGQLPPRELGPEALSSTARRQQAHAVFQHLVDVLQR